VAMGKNFLTFYIEVYVSRLAASIILSSLLLFTRVSKIMNFSSRRYISHHFVKINGTEGATSSLEYTRIFVKF
jgi:hypothetical protein